MEKLDKMDPMTQMAEIEDLLEIEAKWILDNAFEKSITDQQLQDPLEPRSIQIADRNPKFDKRDNEAPVFVTPYPEKKIDEEARVFLKTKDYIGEVVFF